MTDVEARLAEEITYWRERRFWTINQWRAEAGEDWPRAIGTAQASHDNAIDDIAAERDVLAARVAELEAALSKHGEHRSGCAIWYGGGLGCTCGLHDVLAGSSPHDALAEARRIAYDGDDGVIRAALERCDAIFAVADLPLAALRAGSGEEAWNMDGSPENEDGGEPYPLDKTRHPAIPESQEAGAVHRAGSGVADEDESK